MSWKKGRPKPTQVFVGSQQEMMVAELKLSQCKQREADTFLKHFKVRTENTW